MYMQAYRNVFKLRARNPHTFRIYYMKHKMFVFILSKTKDKVNME